MGCCNGEKGLPRDGIEEAIKKYYGDVARSVGNKEARAGGCCQGDDDPITRDLYSQSETLGIPEQALQASRGCANPVLMAELRPGEVVLDLGSGGGIDVLLSARRVGPGGKAYGLDLTDEMLDLARKNQRQAGVENAEFLKGNMEDIPLPNGAVDVIISNCVINLSTDKDRVFEEMYRVLRSGGRVSIADVVHRGELPEGFKQVETWAGCLAGTLEEEEYKEKLSRAGFAKIQIIPFREYTASDINEFVRQAGKLGKVIDQKWLAQFAGKFASVVVKAEKL